MFILVTDINGKTVVIKCSDIRRVYQKDDTSSYICFTTTKNTPITIKGTPEDFFRVYLEPKS